MQTVKKTGCLFDLKSTIQTLLTNFARMWLCMVILPNIERDRAREGHPQKACEPVLVNIMLIPDLV